MPCPYGITQDFHAAFGQTWYKAQELYGVIEHQRGTMPLVGMKSADLEPLSSKMNNLDQATARYEDALALCRKAGYFPELAWTRLNQFWQHVPQLESGQEMACYSTEVQAAFQQPGKAGRL